MKYKSNITNARVRSKAFYIVSDAYHLLKDGAITLQLPGKTTKIAGTLVPVNGGKQGLITCPDLYLSSPALPSFPLLLGDQIEYKIKSPACIQIVSIIRGKKGILVPQGTGCKYISLSIKHTCFNDFLSKYNSKKCIDVACSMAIKAALGHNSLYDPKATNKQRNLVRIEWESHLKYILKKYKNIQVVKTYESDIEDLKSIMNSKFSHVFRSVPHPKFATDPGFRISHAQKSISVFLKHAWCMGLVDNPPQCPVDRIILSSPGIKCGNPKWGYVNSIHEHRIKIKYLTDVSLGIHGLCSLAEWELVTF